VRAVRVVTMVAGGQRADGDALASWAEGLAGRGNGCRSGGACGSRSTGGSRPRTGRTPVTSRARQLQQAVMLIAGRGVIVAEFFDTGESRACRGRGARRPPPWSHSWRTRTDAPVAGGRQRRTRLPR